MSFHVSSVSVKMQG
uniref:Uncharacterized protein n=1 Tax=Anguilla anguilla TaxID=7936 RepID=A0A0E9VUI7_ANGAN